ncbi:conserved hypothetical protein [Verticillium alfalfae VaMs.102]|uniref:Cyclin N-terminal domain-containing protein n=1 Tax=Verticillium alfalfae (strain VaMs.102 / ATCC MYA-4576 / FGSC 10136) TaxID=526221 RepID=C9S7J8_VERA1|nr:conserved hypothetical protein [Verticillium alfalfae VaMs.102]EEY14759.1 conserved hypothetical protein [Verticillium alfalfae VaMs.102]
MGIMARDPAVVSDDDYEVEDMYFTYRPLSNLPTPPLSSRNSSADHSPKVSFDELDAELLQDKYFGPAVHLINLVPTSASLRTPSTSAVQSLLARTALPLESIALASCILDSLNSKFALSWRLSCPLIADPSLSPSKRHSLAGPFFQQRQMHIDSVQPELIVLAALVIAAKFTEDQQDSTAYYCASWGRNIWSCEQLNVTERCICENLNWRIKPLVDDEDLITETLVDMQLAARTTGLPNDLCRRTRVTEAATAKARV